MIGHEQQLQNDDKNKNTPLLGSLMRTVQNFVALALAWIAIPSAAGSVIVSSHLSQYTDVHGFSINSGRYLAAGVILIIFLVLSIFLLWVSYKFIEILTSSSVTKLSEEKATRLRVIGVLVLVGIVVFVMWSESVSPGTIAFIIISLLAIGLLNFVYTLSHVTEEEMREGGVRAIFARTMTQNPQDALRDVVRQPLSMTGVYLFIVAIFYMAVAGYLFSITVYRQIPRPLGGGDATAVNVIFADENQLELLRLPTISRNETATLCLLAELTTGFLVYDPDAEEAVAIKHDSILGIARRWYRDRLSATGFASEMRLQRFCRDKPHSIRETNIIRGLADCQTLFILLP